MGDSFNDTACNEDSLKLKVLPQLQRDPTLLGLAGRPLPTLWDFVVVLPEINLLEEYIPKQVRWVFLMGVEKRCSLLDFILQLICFCQTLICSPDAMISGLGSIKVINNLPLLHLLVGTLIYHIDVRVKVSHPLIKKKKKKTRQL